MRTLANRLKYIFIADYRAKVNDRNRHKLVKLVPIYNIIIK
jgi:hypothetical protein